MQAILEFVAAVVGLFVGALIVVFGWVTLFVGYLGYDYVTVSNVLFVTSLVLPLVTAVFSIFTRKDWITTVIMWIVVYPFVLSSAFQVYEHFLHPGISLHVSWLADYRGVVAVPFAYLGSAISHAGPSFSSAVKTVEGSPLLMMLASAVTGAFVQTIFKRLFPSPSMAAA